MPSTSPGNAPPPQTLFEQILPGAPSVSLQTVACFSLRQKRYVVYISGRQLNIFSGPHVLVQCLSFSDDLTAVTAETWTGRIALAGRQGLWIITPVLEGWTSVRWEKTLYLRLDDPGDQISTLSWGMEEEVLVGGIKNLCLFSTQPASPTSAASSLTDPDIVAERRSLWSKRLPSPVQHAAFSPSGTLIATCGVYDRLVKIWRRLSFEEGLFDHMYLPHPCPVTSVQWRPRPEPIYAVDEDDIATKQDDDLEVLYTIAHDGILRVWKTGTVHDLDILTLHTTVDLVSAVPESPTTTHKPDLPTTCNQNARFTCILSSDQFCAAVNAAIGTDETQIHSSEHLKEVASKEPEVLISFDGQGRMSAWGLQSIGHKRRPETPTQPPSSPFHITQAEKLPVRFPEGVNALLHIWCEGRNVNLIGHSSDGKVQWWRGNLQDFFSLSFSGSTQLNEAAYWSGHAKGEIGLLAALSVGRSLLSVASGDDVLHWAQRKEGVLEASQACRTRGQVIDVALLAHDSSAQLSLSLQLASAQESKGVLLLLRDQEWRELSKLSQEGEVDWDDREWRLFVPYGSQTPYSRCALLHPSGRVFSCLVDSAKRTLLHATQLVLPENGRSDPLLHLTAIIDSIDPDRFGVVALSTTGDLLLYHLQASNEGTLDPVLIAVFESGVRNASVLASNNDFAFVVSSDGLELTIVDLTDGYVEYRLKSDKQIRSILPNQLDSLVAIRYDTTIDILAQCRIGYREEMPPWVLIKQISISNVGLTISSLTWLGDGSLAIAASSVIFVSSNVVDVDSLDADVREATGAEAVRPQTLRLSTVSKSLRKPLPVWHPTFVAHIVRLGHWALAASLVNRLLEKVKFWSEGDLLPALLNVPASQLYGAEGVQEEKPVNRETVDDILEQLNQKQLPQISRSEQRRLASVLQAMIFCSEHVNGLDNLALRYLFSWKMELLLTEAKHPSHGLVPNGLSTDHAIAPSMHWREVAFAFHSTSQQPLLDVLMEHYDNKITWDVAKRLGLFAWLSDREALDRIFEALAQTAYRSASPPDPINASLYFLALHKKQTLLGLWRIATWHKEQRATINFLRRDFNAAENQTAAKKNAYALMGKRRFEYAAAFFLLADDGASAVSVLAGQCGDVMLAIAVGRLYSGDTSPAIRRLLEERLIPEAKQKNDRWLLSWSYSLLRELEQATHAVVRPLRGVRDWQQDDPALLNLYQHLRQSESEYGFDAVLRAARTLRRMGLWLVALELVSKWTFKRPEAAKASFADHTPNGMTEEAPSILDEFTEPEKRDGTVDLPEVTTAQDEKAAREAKAAELLKQIKAKKAGTAQPNTNNQEKKQPTQFKEPDASSLLDSFGL
ncbi:RAVE protein 1 C terminal-domain-containing protein [Neohortaea acidophila]|uniref:RAVE protein 1 C terminal-domain-containing protein n=1 Tax=Neohortaea acidophila TaxID=245834 RepID=A0A6A6PJ79_9PEZI|nr:RAVE protein 1 C terminal-domain-containing protein [Neohortaea acidophila]KAF2480108.1 RAVE protein 1 C terminal-domain-containing protein [Neohortaea acidophila]